MPKKPSRPARHITFPKGGTPSFAVSEAFPDDKDLLELAIAQKFIASMAFRFQRELSEPTKIEDEQWPDFWTSERSRKIGVEVVEVVNLDHIARSGTYGSVMPVNVEDARRLLTDTIQRKLAKCYQPARGWSLWLLAYDVTGALSGEHDLAAQLANTFLKEVEHHFAEVWLIWPTADPVPSFLESVWPTNDFTSTERRNSG